MGQRKKLVRGELKAEWCCANIQPRRRWRGSEWKGKKKIVYKKKKTVELSHQTFTSTGEREIQPGQGEQQNLKGLAKTTSGATGLRVLTKEENDLPVQSDYRGCETVWEIKKGGKIQRRGSGKNEFLKN